MRSSPRLVFYYSYLYPSPPEIESSPVISHYLIIVSLGSLISFSYSISHLSTTSKIFHSALWNSGSVIRMIYYISTATLNSLAFLLYLKLDSAEVTIFSTLPPTIGPGGEVVPFLAPHRCSGPLSCLFLTSISYAISIFQTHPSEQQSTEDPTY